MGLNVPVTNKPRVVIVGGGFAGLYLAKGLRGQHFQVVLIDKHNYHTFQPLLYQVATAGLEPDSIAYPIRRVLQRYSEGIFRLAEVEEIDTQRKEITTNIGALSYDYLVLATGSTTNFFGLQPVADQMMPMKSVPEALNLRSLLFQNFEKALLTSDLHHRKAAMNVVIVGGGPTGVELAGALAEMQRHVLPKDYPELDLRQMEVHLFERSPRLLAAMSEKSSAEAEKYLSRLGVKVWTGVSVDEYTNNIATLSNGAEVGTETLIWAAGVRGVFPNGIDEEAIVGGRLLVDGHCRLQHHNHVFVLGDVAKMVTEETPNGLPMLASVATQQGMWLAKNLAKLHAGKEAPPFKYRDKGSMATIGRNRAVVDLTRAHFTGSVAWFMWMFVHILLLVGFRNKAVTFIGWVWNYFTYDRSLRLIIRPFARKTAHNPPKKSVVAEQ